MPRGGVPGPHEYPERAPSAPAAVALAEVVEEQGEDCVWHLVEAGQPLDAIVRKLGIQTGTATREQARQALRRWLDSNPERYVEAKRASAEALVEQGGAILDNEERPPADAAEARWRSDRASWRRWLAGTRDPGQFGEKKDSVQVNVDIGQLHLEALRLHGSMPKEPEAIEAEVVEESEGSDDG